jgi:hypothetical protein
MRETLGNIQKAHRTNSTFGFCQHANPTLKKPKELFLANARPKEINEQRMTLNQIFFINLTQIDKSKFVQ